MTRPNARFADPDPTTFTVYRTSGHRCGCVSALRDTVTPRLARELLGWRPRRCWLSFVAVPTRIAPAPHEARASPAAKRPQVIFSVRSPQVRERRVGLGFPNAVIKPHGAKMIRLLSLRGC